MQILRFFHSPLFILSTLPSILSLWLVFFLSFSYQIRELTITQQVIKVCPTGFQKAVQYKLQRHWGHWLNYLADVFLVSYEISCWRMRIYFCLLTFSAVEQWMDRIGSLIMSPKIVGHLYHGIIIMRSQP